MVPRWRRWPTSLGVRRHGIGVRDANGFDGAFGAVTRERCGRAHGAHRSPHASLTGRASGSCRPRVLPAMYTFGEFARSGGLMSYGPSVPEMFRRAAVYVDRIFKGGQARRPPRRAAHAVRACDQLEDGDGPGCHHPPVIAAAGGSSDPVSQETKPANRAVLLLQRTRELLLDCRAQLGAKSY